MFQTMMEYMPVNMRNIAIKEFGSIEQWKKHYMEVVSSEKCRKAMQKWLNGMAGKTNFYLSPRIPSAKKLQKAITDGLKQFYKSWLQNGIVLWIPLK